MPGYAGGAPTCSGYADAILRSRAPRTVREKETGREQTMSERTRGGRMSDPDIEWDDFATGDFESGEDEDA